MGLLLGLFSGFLASLEHRALRVAHDRDPILINLLRFTLTILILGILGIALQVITVPEQADWAYIASSLVLEIAIMYTYVRALQLSEQSLVGPLFGLSLVFLVPLSALFLGEYPSLFGLLGIGLIVGGILVLRAHGTYSLTETLRALRTDRGAHHMLIASVTAAISMTVIKGSFISGIHPVNFGFWVTLGLLMTFSIVAYIRNVSLREVNRASLIAAALFGIGQISMYIGVSLTNTAYFIALKRSSIFFDVVIGKFLGGELHLEWKVLGALVILLGVVTVILG